MPVKVTKSLTLKTLIPDMRKSLFNSKVNSAIKEEIIDHIESGRSPVKGERFKRYSDSYSKLKGRRRPVDMLVTGTMLRSLQVKSTKSSFVIAFTNKIARIHNDVGAGLSRVVRRLLPTRRGERFAVGIANKIRKAAEAAVGKAVKKQNRR